MEIMSRYRESEPIDLDFLLWETYGPTPLRFLQMKRWAENINAFQPFSIEIYRTYDSEHQACKLQPYNIKRWRKDLEDTDID